MIKLHNNQIQGICLTLEKIFTEHEVADKALQAVFKTNSKWGSRDRKQMGEVVYEMVRNKVKIEKLSKSSTITNWVAFYLENKTTLEETTLESISEELSIPTELYEYGKEKLPTVWDKELAAMHSKAAVYLRPNITKINVEHLSTQLEEAGFSNTIRKENISLKNNTLDFSCIELLERKSFAQLDLYLDGYFEVQDIGSQVIGHFINPEKDKTIIDACAGAGGKTLHLADILENSGKILALDIHKYKLQELEKRATRNGYRNISTLEITSKTISNLKEQADYLLLDVPCTGIGTLKRQPDLKYRITPKSIAEKVTLQQTILGNYHTMLKSGGTLIYATCSIFPAENEAQIEWFLEQQKGTFSLIEMHTLYPSEINSDGFFMAKLQKK